MTYSKRLMLYCASLPGGGVEHFTVQMSAALNRQLAGRPNWATSILGTSHNSVGRPITWPTETFQALSSDTQRADMGEQVYQNANPDEFGQLIAKDSHKFDVLYLPAPWGNIPLGTRMPIPAPVVLSVHDLEFERSEYGMTVDQYRREAEKLASLGAAFVFSSETIRQEAITRYRFPAERTHLIRQAPSHGLSADAVRIRRKYHLPERFAFVLRWASARKNGGVILQALAQLAEREGKPLPVVGAGFAFDDVLPHNVAHQRYQEQCGALIETAGLKQSGRFLDLGVVDAQDIASLIAAASLVVAPSLSEAGLSYALLDAIALRTPILYSRIPVFTEQLGDEGRYGLSFNPDDPNELANALTEFSQNPEAAQARAEAAYQVLGQRSQDDVAAEYWRLFEAVSETPWRTRPRQRTKPMAGREERVAWLINHTTLRDAELPVIRSFGLEVYTSKELPSGNEFRTASVDYSEDEHSTLPNWVLDKLNAHNFYEEGIPPDIMNLLNGYFGTIIVTSFFSPVRDSVSGFAGRILLRVFGREHPHNYSEYLTFMGKGDFWRRVWEIGNRFWFTPCYDSISPIEGRLLQDRTVMLPLALPERILRLEKQKAWLGTDKRIMFLCPRIHSAPNYYGAIYREFKQHLGHLPHIIPGHQPIPVNDPHVTGFATDDQMRAWFRELRVMFYHSREPRHLHYHPLEAVAYGMPLIYMRGGLVEALMGTDDQPGACATYAEAEAKLRRVLNDDQAFIEELVTKQKGLLDTFRPEYMRQAWQVDFIERIMNTPRVPDVLPFAQWPKVDAQRYGTAGDAPLQAKRSILVYGYIVPGGGIHKYVVGLLDACARLSQAHGWTFDLRWSLPLVDSKSYSQLTWEGHPPANLAISLLPRTREGSANDTDENQPNDRTGMSSSVQRKAFLRGTGKVVQWRASDLYLRNRALRVASECIILPAQYLREVIYQRKLKPDMPGMRTVLKQTRLGNRFLNSRWGAWIDSGLETPPLMVEVEQVVDGVKVVTRRVMKDQDILTDPPRLPSPKPLPELDMNSFRGYITLDDIERLATQCDVVYFPNPFRLISPNTPLDQVKELPVVVTLFDLAHEFTDAWANSSDSVSREMVIWGRLAKRIIFGSEFIRTEAVKRYGILEEKTVVIKQPPMVLRRDRPSDEEIAEVKARLSLPERYLFNTGFQGGHKNNIIIFEALRILRWRGYPTPPLVIGGVDSRKLLLGTPINTYFGSVQQVIKDAGLQHGRDFITLDFIEERDLSSVYAGASIGISMSRSEMALHGMITESMLYRTPVISSTIAVNVDELGEDDRYALLAPPDDPVALADAIQYTLDHPGETAARVQRAHDFIQAYTWERHAADYLRVFEQVSAWQQQHRVS